MRALGGSWDPSRPDLRAIYGTRADSGPAGKASEPAERMKTGSPHNVPLSIQALEILKKARELQTDNDLIFPSPVNNAALSSNALLHALQKRLKIDATIHGMRSSFKDWASETTNYSNEVSEMALAHIVSNKVEGAYRRGDLLEKRRWLMQDWSNFVSSSEEKTVQLLRKTTS